MNVTAKIALHLIPESLKSQPVFIRFAGIEISYYEQKNFLVAMQLHGTELQGH